MMSPPLRSDTEQGRRRGRSTASKEPPGPYVVEEQLILWEHPAFRDLAVLEPIEAMGTPFHYRPRLVARPEAMTSPCLSFASTSWTVISNVSSARSRRRRTYSITSALPQ
jgi:hypothetical protein